MQSLPRRTSTYLALSLLNIKSMEYNIDYRQLIFFGQLCCLPSQYCIKELFIHRLVEFKSHPCSVQGFVPDIHRILGKYSFLEVLDRFESEGVFMSKMSWKHAVRENMKLTIDREWRLKSSNLSEVNSILRITDLNSEFVFWEVSIEFLKYYPIIQKAVRMLGLMFCEKWVRKCQFYQSSISIPTEHMLLYCSQIV